MKAGQLWESAARTWGLGDDDTMAEIKRITNKNYYRICEIAAFPQLMRQISVTFDGSDLTGTLLPANLIGITGVTNLSKAKVYKQTNREQLFTGLGTDTWHYVANPTEPLAMERVTINRGSTEVSGLSEDHTGEWITFGAEPGYYLLTSQTEIASTYWGNSINQQYSVVRPPSCRRIALADGVGDPVADTVEIHYWAYPLPLYLDSDEIRLPDSRALELMVWLDIVGSIEKRKSEADGYRDELENDALPNLKMKTKPPFHPVMPRGRNGRVIRFGRLR